MTEADEVKARVLTLLEKEEKVFALLMQSHKLVQEMVASSQSLGLEAPMIGNALQLILDNLVSCDVQLDMVQEQLNSYYHVL